MPRPTVRWSIAIFWGLSISTAVLFFQNCSSPKGTGASGPPAQLSQAPYSFDASKPILGKFDTLSLSGIDYGVAMIAIDHTNQVLNVSADTCATVNFQLGQAYYQALISTLQVAKANSIYNIPYNSNSNGALPDLVQTFFLNFKSNVDIMAVIDDGHLDQDQILNPSTVLTEAQGMTTQLDAINAEAINQMHTKNPACNESASSYTQTFGTSVSSKLLPTLSAPVSDESAPITSITGQAILSFSGISSIPNTSRTQTVFGYVLGVYLNQTQGTIQIALGTCAPVAGSSADYQQILADLSVATFIPNGAGPARFEMTLLDGTFGNWAISDSEALNNDLNAIGARMTAAYPSCAD